MLRHFFPLLLVTVIAPITLLGQSADLTGTVTDASTRITLPGANILVLSREHEFGTVSDTGGVYRITLPHPGSYRVRASYVGYVSKEVEVDLTAGETAHLDLALDVANVLANPITVTASKRPEKLLDAPAAVSVVSSRQIESRTVLSPADILKGVSSVDLVSTGLNSSRIVIRGFNDNLAKSLLTMVDYRIAQVPVIRLSAMQLIPVGTSDIDRIEVVSGPASALYGPNSANGVVHIITKSPFESQGTTLSVAGGQRDLFMGSFRHAGVLSDRIGYKFSGQYYRATDFEFHDPVETSARQAALAAGASPDTLRIGARNYGIKNLALDGRIDYRFPSGSTVIMSGGFTRGDNIEISPTGAVQAVDAIVQYIQTRLSYRQLFAQVFYNHLDSGKTFSLRTGEPFKQNSGFFVAQVQHSLKPAESTRLTYGLDLYLTRPGTDGTTNGMYENRDNINELGSYLQTEQDISDKLEFVGAARADYNNVIGKVFFSPRVAAVYKPLPGQTARLTYNRAFQTPSADQFFTDVLGQRDIFMLGALQSTLGFPTATDLRAMGTGRSSLHFVKTANGLPRFRSPFAPLDPRGLTPQSFVDFNDPVFNNVLWGVARDALAAGLPSQLAEKGVIDPGAIADMSRALQDVLPQSLDGIKNTAMVLDIDKQQFVPMKELLDVNPLQVTRTETYEFGYKAFLSRSFITSFDVYHTRVKNFIGPYLVATPNIFLDGATIQPELEASLVQTLSEPGHSDDLAALQFLDQLNFLGNRNGTPADEVASLITLSASQIPLGTVSPEGASDPTAILLVRRNFGNISLSGLDAAFTFLPGSSWTVGGTLSLVTKNFFRNVDGVQDIALNAPKTKAGVSVGRRFEDLGLDTNVRFRFVGGFPVRSDVYVGEVDPYSVVDLSLNYRFPYRSIDSINLTVQNVTDNKHREFVGVPELGRVGIIRLTRTF